LERNYRASLRSRIFDIRFLMAETRFESTETGRDLVRTARRPVRMSAIWESTGMKPFASYLRL